jgi:hypothetical protein
MCRRAVFALHLRLATTATGSRFPSSFKTRDVAFAITTFWQFIQTIKPFQALSSPWTIRESFIFQLSQESGLLGFLFFLFFFYHGK